MGAHNLCTHVLYYNIIMLARGLGTFKSSGWWICLSCDIKGERILFRLQKASLDQWKIV